MATTSFRILQRRSSTSGVTPQLCTLCDGELFVQLADETIYFRNDKNQLVCTLTDKNLGNLCNIFAPTGDYVTNSQTGAFASIGNYVTTSQTGDLSSVFAPVGNYVTATQTGDLSSVFAPVGNYVTATQTGDLSSVFAPVGNYAVIVDGHIPAQYLPSYVDDVQEFDTITGLCAHAGEKGHIYLVSGCNSFWRWGGSQYVEIYASPGTSDGLVEGSTNLYFTAARSAGYVATGSTGSFVTTSQTGVFALSANTGNFVNTGRIGNLAIGGSNHSITGTNNVIYGGYLNSIAGTGVGTINCNNAILAGTGNCINFGYESAIIGGRVNLITGSSFHGNAIIGGLNNIIRSGYLGIITSSESSCIEESNAASIIGGRSNRIFCGNCSSIIGGCNNQLNSTRSSVILGGSGIIGTACDTVYVQNLCVARGIIYGNGLGITGMATGCFVTTSQTGVFETTDYARNCYVTTGETGSFLVGKIGTNINLGDSSNKSCLNEKSFLGAGVCNNQSGICCSFLGAGNCNQQHGWFSETGACIIGRYYPPGLLSGLGFGEVSFLGAGCCNRQCGDYASFLGAGQKNRQFYNRHSFLGAGANIYQCGSIGSFLGAGNYNSQQISTDSFVGAGYNNFLRAQFDSAIAAGYHNAINGLNDTGFYGSFIGAGLCNNICGSTHASILAGCNNYISGTKESSIVVGSCNLQLQVGQSFIGGGYRNKQILCSKNLYNFPCENAFIGAGGGNVQECEILNTFIGAGETNCQANSFDSFIGAGAQNLQELDHFSFIGAGFGNCQKCSCASFVGAGCLNCVSSGEYNFLGAGENNKIINSFGSSILAGENNQISGGKNVFILGSGITGNNQSNILYVNNLCINGIISGNGAGLTGLNTGNFITTSQTGSFGGSIAAVLCSGVNTLYEAFTSNPIVNTNLINFDIIPNSTLYYTGNTSTNFYLNLRGNSATTFNSVLPLNNSLSVTFMHTNAATAYSLTGISIDGTPQTVRWSEVGGTPSGLSNSTNAYTISVFKTGNNLYRTFGSLGYFI